MPASCWANIRVEQSALVRWGVGGREERVLGAVEVSFACLRRRRDFSVGVRLGRGECGGMRVMGSVVGDGVWVVNESGDGGDGCGVFTGVFDRRLRLWVSIRKTPYLLDSRSLLLSNKIQGLLLWKTS